MLNKPVGRDMDALNTFATVSVVNMRTRIAPLINPRPVLRRHVKKMMRSMTKSDGQNAAAASSLRNPVTGSTPAIDIARPQKYIAANTRPPTAPRLAAFLADDKSVTRAKMLNVLDLTNPL
jgi:hypothetical protein